MSFDQYEEDYLELKKNIENRIKSLPSLEDPKKRHLEVKQVETDIIEAQEAIRSMDLSARNISGNSANAKTKVKNYENELTVIKSNLRRAEASASASSDRDELFGGYKESNMASSMESRQRLIDNTQKLDKSSRYLENALITAHETIEVGINSMELLDRQKNTLKNSIHKTEDIDHELGTARKLVRSISRGIIGNKIVVAVIAIVLLAGIGFIVYWVWIKPMTSDSGASSTGMTNSTTTTTGMLTTGQVPF